MQKSKRWQVNAPLPTTHNAAPPDINPVVFRLLATRGVTPALMAEFLAPDYAAHVHDPFLFRNMRTAVAAIVRHLTAGNAIIVYGDYDADGVTSSAIMVKTLQFLAMQLHSDSSISVYIPDRISEGYGMNTAAMDAIAKNGAKLVITVDTGIRNAAVVEHAQTLGLDVIVTDHHEAPADGTLPDCPVINPKVPGETYPFDALAGCGVAFKVCQAILQSAAATAGDAGEFKRFEKWLLDLVAIGTIADLMPLVDENRVLVTYGLVVLNKTKRIGLQKLMEIGGSAIDRQGNIRTVEAWQVGFQIAPRLNAAGRLDHANSAYQLLVTDDIHEATRIAQQLDATNSERQNITQDIFEQVEAQHVAGDEKILFAVWPGAYDDTNEDPWPLGVMGLVAGKLTERHYLPALAITVKHKHNEQGEAVTEIVGSGRSIPEFDITAMLEECKEFLTHYGGHKQACGFTVANGKLEAFLQKARAIAARTLHGVELVPTLEIDMAIELTDVTEELYTVLAKLKPYGIGNAQPTFVSYNLPIVDIRTMGSDGQHVKIKVQAPNKITYDCVAFNVIDDWKRLAVGERVDIVYYIDMNEWNGRRDVQLKVVDVQKHVD